MTTPYRKAAEVEPRVRYGWRLTERGKGMLRTGAFAVSVGSAIHVFGGAPPAITMMSMVAALLFGETVVGHLGMFERYEKP